MRLIGPVMVVVATAVAMVATIPAVPASPALMSDSRHSASGVRPSGSKGDASELAKFAQLKASFGSRGLVHKSKKKDLSKMKFADAEERRIQKKALLGLSKEKRAEKLRLMRGEKKRTQAKVQEQTKALQKLEKKHKSFFGEKKTSKAKENVERVKRRAEMKQEKEEMKIKLAKQADKKKAFKKAFLLDNESPNKKKKDAKVSKKLDNGKHLKKNLKSKHLGEKKGTKQLKHGSFLLKHFYEDDGVVLKSAQPYMKEGRTPDQRRALKALRLRIKREAKEGKAAQATLTKAAADVLKSKAKFIGKGTAALHAEKKAALKGRHSLASPEKRAKNLEDEVSGNELGVADVPALDLENEAVGVPSTDDNTSGDLETDQDESPKTTTSSDDSAFVTTFPPTTVKFSEISAEPNAEASITYEEPSSSGNSVNSPESLEIVTLASIDVNGADKGEIREPISAGIDDLNVPEIPEISDNSLVPNPEENSAEPNTEPAATTTTAAPTEAPANTRNGPWPWEATEEGEEPCGRARFGPETRLNRGTSLLKILQGKEALPGAFPWQVAILDSDRDLRCGGTLIAPRWVMTAAHCAQKRMLVRLSEHHIHQKEGYEIEQKVRRVFVHPAYNRSTIDNDIALLRLPALPPFRNNTTGALSRGVTDKACLPSDRAHFPPVGTRCLVMGWGKASMSGVSGTDVLMYTRLPIISHKACRRANRKNITENMFCAGHYKGGSDTCSGDSGGPLLCSIGGNEEVWTVFGVTSFGDGCGVAGKMGVYAKVNNYLDWIAGIMRRYVM